MTFNIRATVFALALAPAALTTLLISAYYVHTQLNDLQRAFTARGQLLTDQLAASAEYGLISANTAVLESVGQHAPAQVPDLQRVVIRRADGAIVLQLGPRGAVATGWVSFQAAIVPTLIGVNDNVFESDRAALPASLGAVEVSLSPAALYDRQRQVAKTGALLLLGCLAVLALGGWWLGQRLIAPLLLLERVVHRLRAGQLEARVPVLAGGEVGELQAGVNAMATALQAARTQLQQQVAAATAELRQALAALTRQNQALDAARQQAEDSSRAKSEFLALVSHEIRTPLHGVTGFLPLLAGDNLTPRQTECLHLLQASADTLRQILDSLLDFARIEAGKLVLAAERFNLPTVLANAVSLYQPDANAKGVALGLERAPNLPDYVIGDSKCLTQIVTNLVSNAVKFTAQGAVVVEVDAAATGPGAVTVHLVIRDTGIGIAERDLNSIFEPFHQGDASTTREQGGAGLGLAICHQLVQLMGGEIAVRSRLGQGSTFTIALPLVVAAAGSGDAGSYLNTIVAAPAPRQIAPTLRLLVVDDNGFNRRWTEFVLGEVGCVDLAGSAEDALRQCTQNRYHVILMDIRMPDMDGLEATRRLRAWDGNPNQHVPIIALTADVTPQTSAKMRASGFTAYLYKPLDADSLLETIRPYLEG